MGKCSRKHLAAAAAARTKDLAVVRREIAAGRIVSFSANHKSANTIVKADGARCTGKPGGGTWCVACGEPVGNEDAECRVAFRVTKTAGAFVCLNVVEQHEAELLRIDLSGLSNGTTLGIELLTDSGRRFVTLHGQLGVHSNKMQRRELPDGEYRFAVGGSGDRAAFEMVDMAAAAAFWVDVANHQHLTMACGGLISNDWKPHCLVLKAIEAGGAIIGVIPANASRQKEPGRQEGDICLESDGWFWVDGHPVRTGVKGFSNGDIVGVAVLRGGGKRVVAFYVDGEEVAWEVLPEGEYRFAVGGHHAGAVFESVDPASAAATAFWDRARQEENLARREENLALEHVQSEIAAGRLAGFDANDKGELAIVEAGGARCTGRRGNFLQNFSWSVAFGEPIGLFTATKAVKATKALDASVGVISSAASREAPPGLQEGGIGLRPATEFDNGGVRADNKLVVRTVKGFTDGDTVGAAVLRDGGGRVVAFYVNGEEVARHVLPDGEYRFAVGGFGHFTAFEMVDARESEWGPQDHERLHHERRSTPLTRLKQQIALERLDRVKRDCRSDDARAQAFQRERQETQAQHLSSTPAWLRAVAESCN